MDTKKNCILYLVRTSPDDVEMLNKSLGLIEVNVLSSIRVETDVLLFHEKSFDRNYRNKVRLVNNGMVIFQEIEFALPEYPEEIKKKIPEFYPHPTDEGHRGFGMGYRHMCNFFAGSLYEQPILQNYEYYLRLDTDSFILSKLHYDIFEWIRAHKCEYGFIESAIHQDHPKVIEGLWDETRQWLLANNIKTYTPFETLPEGKMFYTNFELGKVSSYSPGSAYYEYYSFIKKTGGIFIHRWGDAPIKYLGVSLFIKPEAVQSVYGFIYQHGACFDLSRWRANPFMKVLLKIKRSIIG
jgi:alpha 1,2-mannosyltransferase